MARLHRKIEKEHGGDKPGHLFKYRAPNGEDTIVPPALLAEWVRAVVREFPNDCEL